MNFIDIQHIEEYQYEDISWERIFHSFNIIEDTITQDSPKTKQMFQNITDDTISKQSIHEYRFNKQEGIIRNNLQIQKNNSYNSFDDQTKILVSQVIAKFYLNLNPSKYVWDHMDIDMEDDMCIKFQSRSMEVSISLEGITGNPDFDLLDSYLSIFKSGRRVSYSRPLKTLMGILNNMSL